MDTDTNTDTTPNTRGESTAQTNFDRLLVRARVALDEWFVLVVVALLALSLIGGWGAFTALAADSSDEEDTTEPWSTTGGFEHYAVVQAENEVFDVGTELTDRSAYFATIAPELEGEFQYRYEAAEGDVAVDVEIERVVRAVEDGEVHWSVSEPLETTSVEGVEPGEERTASFAVNVPATENESERIESSLGSSPGTVETVVIAEVTVTGTVNGDPVERTDVYELEIDASGDVYYVEGPSADRWSADGEQTDEPATASSFGFLGPVSSIAVLLGSLGALGAVTVAKRRGTLAPSQAELERLRIESERESFDDWISRGSIPNTLHDRPRIIVDTLEDLVDIAIDCDRRVIQDGQIYYVVDDELLYLYEPDPWSGTSAFAAEQGDDGDGDEHPDEEEPIPTIDESERR